MNDCMVSIIIPVYNSEKYIFKTIESICCQTYKNFEVVLVDDESSDKSIDIAYELLCANNIKHNIIRQKNKGLPGARNAGIKVSTGDYLCFIDSDDIISPNHLSDLISIITENELEVAFSMFEYVNEGNRFGKRNETYQSRIIEKSEFLYNFLRRKPAVHCCSLMIKSSVMKNLGLEFNEKLRKYGEDVEFMWRLLPCMSKIGCTGNYTYKYLVRNNSLMTTGIIEPWDVFINEFNQSIRLEQKKQPNLSTYYSWAYYRTLLGLLRIIAENVEYKVFFDYAKKLVTKEMTFSLNTFPDNRIRFMAFLLKNHKRWYYLLYRKRIRFYNEFGVVHSK